MVDVQAIEQEQQKPINVTMQFVDKKHIVKVDGQVVAVCWCWQDAYSIINGRQGHTLKEEG